MAEKILRDALHADIRFTDQEMAVIDTPPVQRLRGIRQLGASHLVYPSAVHTRFEHTLGTCWLAKRLQQRLIERGVPVEAEDLAAVPLAALLHDVTHIPFGHTFEDERRLFDRHDENEDRLEYFLRQPRLAEALAATGVEPRVRELLKPKAEAVARPYARELISGTICADLLDYLRRDAYHTGLVQGYDDRLFRALDVADDHLTVDLQKDGLFRDDVLSELIHLLRVRYNLTERVYYHHAKMVAGAMVSKALELALGKGRLILSDLYDLSDEAFLYVLRDRCRDLNDVQLLLDAYASRRLYKRVYFVTVRRHGRHGVDEAEQTRLADTYHINGHRRRELEDQVAARLKAPTGAVVLYCPAPTMQLKESRVPVRIDSRRVVPLSDLNNPEVASLEGKYRALWCCFVCLHRDYEHLYQRAGQVAEELLGVPNMVRLRDRGQLAFDF